MTQHSMRGRKFFGKGKSNASTTKRAKLHRTYKQSDLYKNVSETLDQIILTNRESYSVIFD